MRRLRCAAPAGSSMMQHELSRSSDSSRTNSREMLEVVLQKKDDDDRLPPHHLHPHHHHHHHHQLSHPLQPLQQLHQLRSTDSGSRLSPMLVRTTHAGQPNNNVGDFSRAPSSFSRKSLSRQSLDSNSHVSDVCDERDNHGHQSHHHEDGAALCPCASGTTTFLHSLGLLAVASLVLSAMSLLLLAAVSQATEVNNVTTHSTPGASLPTDHKDDSARRDPDSYKVATSSSGSDLKTGSTSKTQAAGRGWGAAEGFTLTGQTLGTTSDQSLVSEVGIPSRQHGGARSLREAAVAMATLVVVANLCCLMVCCMQCFFAAKLLKTYEGEARSAKYLRECSSSRFIAVMGFFLSIPAFLVALVLACMLHLPAGPALTTGVMLGVGVLFCVLSVMQNVYHWRVEKSQADEGVPVYHSHLEQQPSRQAGTPAPPLAPLTPSSQNPHHLHHHHHHADHGDLNSNQQNELSTLV